MVRAGDRFKQCEQLIGKPNLACVVQPRRRTACAQCKRYLAAYTIRGEFGVIFCRLFQHVDVNLGRRISRRITVPVTLFRFADGERASSEFTLRRAG